MSQMLQTSNLGYQCLFLPGTHTQIVDNFCPWRAGRSRSSLQYGFLTSSSTSHSKLFSPLQPRAQSSRSCTYEGGERLIFQSGSCSCSFQLIFTLFLTTDSSALSFIRALFISTISKETQERGEIPGKINILQKGTREFPAIK